MADRDIYNIDFKPHRWLLKTMGMPPEHRGNYIQILMLIYAQEGPIDNDHKWISQSCNCSSRLVKSSIEYLLNRGDIYLTQDGKVAQKRAESVLNLKRTYLEHSVNGARVTNEIKAEKRKNKELAHGERKISATVQRQLHLQHDPSTDKGSVEGSPLPTKSSRQKITFDYDKIAFENITEEFLEAWRQAYPAVDIEAQITKMASWLASNPDRKRSKYSDFINRWLSKEQDRGGRYQQRGEYGNIISNQKPENKADRGKAAVLRGLASVRGDPSD